MNLCNGTWAFTSCGFPHSDIHGSIHICCSPWLFAACRVLRRLLVPRHSPCALSNLTFHPVICPPKGTKFQHVIRSLVWVMVLFLLRLKSKTLWWRSFSKTCFVTLVFLCTFVTCKTFLFSSSFCLVISHSICSFQGAGAKYSRNLHYFTVLAGKK